MELVHENVTIDVTVISNDYESEAGYVDLTLPFSIFKGIYEACFSPDIISDILGGTIMTELGDSFINFDSSNDWIASAVYTQSEDDLTNEQTLEYLMGEDPDVVISVPDAIIVFLHNCFHLDSNYKFKYSGNPFWICHDIQHALHDVTCNVVFVDGPIEESRLNEGYDYFIEKGFNPICVTFDMISRLNEDFVRRFGYSLTLPAIFEHLGIEFLE